MGQSGGLYLTPGSAGASILPEFGPQPEDLVLRRTTGLGPMGGTDLDTVLRNLGAQVVVAVGVSVNVAITNFVMDAVNHGYWVVLPRDAVAGVPKEYADSIIDTTFFARAIGTSAAGVLTEVEGAAYRTGEHRFVIDDRDPLNTGFVLR